MTPQEHLASELSSCARYELSPAEQKEIEGAGLPAFLKRQLTRKAFRRWKLPEAAEQRIDTAIAHCIEKNKPITFRYRFGGYKLWRLPSSPEVDWAEFFTFVHYSRYLAPIAAAHKPGVRMIFASDDVFVERLDNIGKDKTEAYYRSFQALLDEFRKYFPENFSMDVLKHSSLYEKPEDLEKEFEEKMIQMTNAWEDKPEEARQSDLATSTLNIRWDGVEDLTSLSDEEKQRKIVTSAIMHDALVALPTIRSFTADNPGIISVFSFPFPSLIAIGTTKTSIAKFWVGTGVLEQKDGHYYDRVLTPGQAEQISEAPHQEIAVDLIPFKNFSSVRIFNGRLDFVK
ncbi:MAG: hypothetical protein V4480_03155 [Patescibacteria group bacterium]